MAFGSTLAVDSVRARRESAPVRLDAIGVPTERREGTARLSPVQQRIVGLIARGLTDKELSQRLKIGDGTVKVYNSAIYKRLGLAGRHQVAAWFYRQKLDALIQKHRASLSLEVLTDLAELAACGDASGAASERFLE